MSFINLARPQLKNSQDIYARNCDFKTLKVDNLKANEILIHNINIYNELQEIKNDIQTIKNDINNIKILLNDAFDINI